MKSPVTVSGMLVAFQKHEVVERCRMNCRIVDESILRGRAEVCCHEPQIEVLDMKLGTGSSLNDFTPQSERLLQELHHARSIVLSATIRFPLLLFLRRSWRRDPALLIVGPTHPENIACRYS